MLELTIIRRYEREEKQGKRPFRFAVPITRRTVFLPQNERSLEEIGALSGRRARRPRPCPAALNLIPALSLGYADITPEVSGDLRGQ